MFYFDKVGPPTTNNLKRYCISYVYNAAGQKTKCTLIGADEDIMNTECEP